MSDHPVVHFEMPYEDAERVTKFYNQAFGWDMSLMPGQEMGNYIVAQTAETDENHMVKTPGTINGGFYPKASSNNPYPSVVISVKDINAAMEAVKNAGGKVDAEPVQIPGIGLYVPVSDTEGNRMSLLQPGRS